MIAAPEHAAEFRRCLIDVDVAGMRAIWAHVASHLPQPADDAQAMVTIHLARTEAASLPDTMRCYSHAWLIERGYPSRLPDHMKAEADRLYPRIAETVGISVSFTAPELKPAGLLIERAMSDVVADIYSDNMHPDPAAVKVAMMAAGGSEKRKLFGGLAK